MKYVLRSIVCASVAALIVACGESFAPLDELPRELSVAEADLVQADNRFAFKLFREINRQEGDTNIFISPLSAAMALGMTLNGAAGSTEQAMLETLELQGLSREAVNGAYRTLIDLLRGLDPSVEFSIANSIWYPQGRTFEQDFLNVNRSFFDAEIRALDFGDPSAPGVINDWVYSNTNGKIEEIIENGIPAGVIMYLINAIYFKGDWTYQFDESRTHDAEFTRLDGSHATVDMMSHEGEIALRSAWSDGVLVAELPYGGGAYCMTILLPQTAGDFHALVDGLTQDRWNTWIAALDSSSMAVSLPRFTLEYELALNDALKALGMEVAFDPAEANFTRMYEPGGIWIDSVIHKTFVEVNEQGTEAAAVTAVVMKELSAARSLYVDRPFVFVIRERFSGSVLFMGKVVDPTAG